MSPSVKAIGMRKLKDRVHGKRERKETEKRESEEEWKGDCCGKGSSNNHYEAGRRPKKGRSAENLVACMYRSMKGCVSWKKWHRKTTLTLNGYFGSTSRARHRDMFKDRQSEIRNHEKSPSSKWTKKKSTPKTSSNSENGTRVLIELQQQSM